MPGRSPTRATYQTKELQYVSGNYRQVLNSEGLSFYVFGAYGWGRPGTVPLESINYRTKSLVFETGLTQPVVRTRERNVSLTALYFQSDDQSELTFSPTSPLPTFDRLRGFRLRLEADWVDPWSGVNQFYGVFSQGIHGARQHQQRRSVLVTVLRPRRLQQVRSHVTRACRRWAADIRSSSRRLDNTPVRRCCFRRSAATAAGCSAAPTIPRS